MSADTFNIHQKQSEPLRCSGIGRDVENSKSLVIYLNRPASDGEMRFLYDVLKGVVVAK